MKDEPDLFRNALAKAEHEATIDRALSALETAAGSRRVRSHLTNPASVEGLAEALRRFRDFPPT